MGCCCCCSSCAGAMTATRWLRQLRHNSPACCDPLPLNAHCLFYQCKTARERLQEVQAHVELMPSARQLLPHSSLHTDTFNWFNASHWHALCDECGWNVEAVKVKAMHIGRSSRCTSSSATHINPFKRKIVAMVISAP